jgi:hypothetical protein
MINQEQQSPEAKAEGVCHTRIECLQMYEEIPYELKIPVLAMLAQELRFSVADIRREYKADPENWSSAYHFWWGMAVRNLLREKGYGEAYFKVHNLDDIYISLVEEALKLHEPI